MNANEIADALDEYNSDGMPVRSVGLASAMLRQQQAEIEALKMEIHSLTYGERLAEYLKKAKK